MMKLKIKKIEARRPTYMLCEEDGTPLPGQVAVTINQHMDELTTVTVEFLVDNKTINME